ncbi:MAG: hypothetical protein LBE38_11645 [Deltaproteobacteria bacterium]|nr:hypothetical protein [Deltaproteobacteria bacterium]
MAILFFASLKEILKDMLLNRLNICLKLLFLTLSIIIFTKPAWGGPVLTIMVDLDPDSPRLSQLNATTLKLAQKTGKTLSLDYLGTQPALAAIRTAQADPDGLTMGLLSLDNVVTMSLEGLMPFSPEDFLAVVLFHNEAPSLVTPLTDQNDVGIELISLQGREEVTLVTKTKTPLDDPTLIALDFFRALELKVNIKELYDNPGIAIKQSPMEAFSLLKEGEFMALSQKDIDELTSSGANFKKVVTLGEDTGANSSLQSLGISPKVSSLSGFFYPAGTTELLAENTPQSLMEIISELAQVTGKDSLFLPPISYGPEAQALYDKETEARRELLSFYLLTTNE